MHYNTTTSTGSMMYQILLVFLLAGLACGDDVPEYFMPKVYDGLAADEDISHPCPDLSKDCIRNYLTEHSGCTPVTETTTSIFRKTQVVYLNYCNMTIFYEDTEISGLDGEITNCYVNHQTNMFVLSVFFKGITISVTDCRFEYHRVGKEPVVKQDGLNATYTAIFTSWTPLDSNGRLVDNTRVSVYVTDSNPTFYIGQDILTGQDEQISKSINCLMGDLKTGLQATFTTEGISMFNAWTKAQMCDFGSPVAFLDHFKN